MKKKVAELDIPTGSYAIHADVPPGSCAVAQTTYQICPGSVVSDVCRVRRLRDFWILVHDTRRYTSTTGLRGRGTRSVLRRPLGPPIAIDSDRIEIEEGTTSTSSGGSRRDYSWSQ